MLPDPIASLAQLPPYVFSQLDVLKAAARARGQTLVDLGIGSPDQPTPPLVVEAAQRAMTDTRRHGYPPFRGTPELLAAVERFLGDRFGVQVDAARQVVALGGSKEGIAHVIAAYCAPGDVALVPDIYYPVYGRAPLLSGARVHLMPVAAPTFLPDLDAVPRDVLARAKVLVVNYPNNPTGAVADRAFLARAVAFAREHRLLLLSDLAYSELTYDDYVAPSIFEIDGAMDVAVEFHSCSKTFNMAGLRLGFAVGGAPAIDALTAYRSNVGYGVAWAAQAAGAAAFEHRASLVPPIVAEYGRRRDAIYGALSTAGWDVAAPSAAMYAWLPVPAGYDDWGWVNAVLDETGVVVTPGHAFGPGGAGYFRISFVQPADVLTRTVPLLAQVAANARVPAAV